MPGESGATALLADFASGLRCETLAPDVRQRLKALLVDYFRVAAHGTRTPWLEKIVSAFGRLGTSDACTILYCGRRADPVRAAYLNATIAGSLEWDDTHVGSMLHPGVVTWPAVLALGETVGADGDDVLAAAAAGYETMIRVGLSVQPSHFRRGFQSTATCGVFGAAAGAARVLRLNGEQTRSALGIAASYAGGLTQFFLSGSEVKRIHAGRASAAGVEAALLAQAGLTGPPDVIEGGQGFAAALADAFDADAISSGLGERYHLMRLQMKPHAVSARVLAAIEAAEAHVRAGIRADRIADAVIGIPSVIAGRLTNSEPADLQQAQMSAPFAVAMTLVLAREMPAPLVFGVDDVAAALARPDVRDMARRVRCEVDDGIDAATGPEYVPARITIRLDDGTSFDQAVFQPAGCPDRPMSVDHISARFRASAGDRIGAGALDAWLGMVADLETRGSAGEVLALRFADGETA